MPRDNFQDLVAFLAVARERSFTKAAAKLGVSQSALSHTVRGLESRLGLRLLTRTTRSVAPTDAGERLLSSIGPHFEEIDAQLRAVRELRDSPSGTIRLASSDHATRTLLWPALKPFLARYRDIKVEITCDTRLIDIAAERYDAGIRFGEQVAKDMIAVPIGPQTSMACVGAPSYFADRAPPRTPQDLTKHDCINLRFLTHGGLYAWEFEKGKRKLTVRVEGQLTFNDVYHTLQAALDGFGLTFVPEEMAQPFLAQGRLKRVLEDWCPPFPGFHLYYPSRRQPSAAFVLLVNALRYKG